MVILPKLECLRCGWPWTPRVAHPLCCPLCKSSKWNVKPKDNELGRPSEQNR